MARDALETPRTQRYRLCSILTGGRTVRDSTVLAAMAQAIAAGSLSAVTTSTFGLVSGAIANPNCAITSGLRVLTSADNPWTAADVGKRIDVAGAGAAGATLTSRIKAYNSAGSVDLWDLAGTTVAPSKTSAGGVAVWGDDINAISALPKGANAAGTSEFASQVSYARASNAPTFRTDSARLADVFNVKDFGALGDATTGTDGTDDTVAIIRAAAALQAAGGGTLFFPPGIYSVCGAFTGTLCGFSALRGVNIIGHGATLRVPTNKAITASEGYFFYFDACIGITVDGFQTDGPTLDVSQTVVKGWEFVRCVNGCRNISMPRNKVKNSLSGFIASKALGDADAMRTQNIHIGVLEVVNCWYGINGQYSGDYLKCDVLRTDTIHRSVFFYGASNLDISVWSKDCVGSSDCPITSTQGVPAENIHLRYHSGEDSFAGSVGPRVKIGFSSQTPNLMRNVHIEFDLRYKATGTTGGAALMIEKLTDAGAPDAADRGHILENLVVSGTIHGTPSYNNGGIIVSDTLATWGTGDYFRNLSLENLYIDSTLAVVLSLAPCEDQILLKNVKTTGALALRHNAAYTRIPKVCKMLLENVLCTNRWAYDGAFHPIENIRGTASPDTVYTGWSGRTIGILGIGGAATWQLPAAAVGLEYYFTRNDAQVMDLEPDGTDTIRGGGAGKYLRMNAAGNFVKLVCRTVNIWEVEQAVGAYTFEP